ncbi:alpha/beta fold hydrolase [Phaeovibrio sulfidiphilus]|uniref:Alpha/beta fold hydrolase n=1 Tax=Phaeovibrio sulfidiphilus TaxID=1220600 RepID=A0A8J6YTU7_9PROT|nr:alpha/beta fold hydrolase [Phaeovibrio sulfidiphilus]MBE1236314.1 alpha/beta fold hydrolase [Phaeovibrio sulfidiphilus]
MSACRRMQRLGTPGTVPVVFLHGLFGSAANWRSVVTPLADVADMHLLDLPNHGGAAWTEDMTYPAMAADVLSWLDAEGLEAPLLVGFSMGGKVAMTLALSAPERLDALAVLDIAPATSPDMEGAERLIALMERLPVDTFATRREAEEALNRDLDEPRLRGFLLQNLERDAGGHFRWRLNLPVLKASLPALKGFPALPGDAVFDAPTVFVKAGRSAYLSDADRPRIRTLFPRSRMVTVRDSGHWLNADAPATLTALLRAFIESAAARRAAWSAGE